MKKMVIGIIPTYIKNKESIYEEYYKFVGQYSKKVIEAGAIPVGILLNEGKLSYDQLELCDGFIIPGGNKVYHYIYEIIDYAIRKNKPLLGICMGAEAIDIYSVIKDNLDNNKKYTLEELVDIYHKLKEENEGSLLRRLDENNIHSHDFYSYDDYENALHKIKISKDSIAYQIFGEEIDVPSMHGFDFKKVGKNFKITAKAQDGVNEIIEYDNKNYFIIGCHFHPELMDTNIFNRLNEECLKRIKE